MPQVFSNDMVAHVWAQQRQESGRNAKGTLFFEGPFLWSYGRHCLAGFVMPGGLGTLINADSCSITTSRHISRASQAARGRTFRVPDLGKVAEEIRGARYTETPAPALARFDAMVTGPKVATNRDKAATPRDLSRMADAAKGQAETLKTPWASVDAIAAIRVLIKARGDLGLEVTESDLRQAAELLACRADRAAEWKARAAWCKEESAYRMAAAVYRQGVKAFAAQCRDLAKASGFYADGALREVESEVKALRAAARVAKRRGKPAMARAALAGADAYLQASRGWQALATRAERRRKAGAMVAAIRRSESADCPAYDMGHGARALRQAGTGIEVGNVNLPPSVVRAFRIAGFTPAVCEARAAAIETRQARQVAADNRAHWRGLVATLRAFRDLPPDAVTSDDCDKTIAALDSTGSGRRAGNPFIKAGWNAETREPYRQKLRDLRRELVERESARAVADWRQGEGPARLRHGDPCSRNGGALLRVKGDMLETSQGAEVPLAHAVRAFRFIRLCRDKGQAWKANGKTLPVGHFRIDSIAANGDFRAGCHFIEWPEVESAAIAAGVFNLTPADTTETREGVHA